MKGTLRSYAPPFALAAILMTGCNARPKPEHVMAFDRAVRETRIALKFPDAAEWPPIEKAHITESGDTISVMFTVRAKNGFGVVSDEMVMMDFRVDSCAHLLGGFTAGRERPRPDLPGRPCDIVARIEWERLHEQEHYRHWDSIDSVQLAPHKVEAMARMDSMLQSKGL